jgi:carboxyl-terminal processing protease
VAGIYLGGHPADLPSPVRDALVEDKTSLQAEAADVVQDNYARKVSDRALENGSLRGMVDILHDRFSHYFTPRENTRFQESIEGQFSGVGMTVVQNRRGLLVTGVFKGSPAAKAKIKPGDLITEVNRASIAGESSDIATAKIKGRPGTFVTLTVLKRPARRKRVIRIKRARIDLPVVTSRVRRVAGRSFGVVRLASFTSGVHAQLRLKLASLLRRHVRGIVLDLRQNGGGLLDEAVLVASAFIPNGVIVVTKGRTRPKQVLRATGKAIARGPLVVLVDRGTASASEIVTAALRERLGAKVVGQRTFGKGVFGELFSLPKGGALDLTLGNYYTPKGHNLAGRGIRPDVRAQDVLTTPPDEGLDRALGILAAEAGRS